jgi:solute carrier family 25 phosphate transporter 23/24/25/41
MQEGRIAQHTMPHPTVHILARNIHRPQYNILEIIRLVLREGGVKAFWRGNGINCLKAGPEFATMFTVRQLLIDKCGSGSGSHFENFALSAAAGGIATTFIYPLELIKARMAVSSDGEYKSVVDCVRQCWRKGGPLEFYHGLGANLAGIVPTRGSEMGIFFSLEAAWKRYTGARPSTLMLMGMGVIASTTSQVLTYPLNLVRLKMQIQGMNGRPRVHANMFQCIQHILATEGAPGLYRGILPNLLKGVPASTLMYVTFRETKLVLESLTGAEAEDSTTTATPATEE